MRRSSISTSTTALLRPPNFAESDFRAMLDSTTPDLQKAESLTTQGSRTARGFEAHISRDRLGSAEPVSRRPQSSSRCAFESLVSFGGQAWSGGALFLGEVDFSGAMMFAEVEFDGAEFRVPVDFAGLLVRVDVTGRAAGRRSWPPGFQLATGMSVRGEKGEWAPRPPGVKPDALGRPRRESREPGFVSDGPVRPAQEGVCNIICNEMSCDR